jgi:hypothetical protein
VYGLEQATRLLEGSVAAAVDALACFGDKAGFLRDIAFYIRDRNN